MSYIVQIDSNYRDTNQYVNSSDFAVSFQLNSSPDYNNIQGNPISPSGYFLNSSIDPDFDNTNLQLSNGYMVNYQQVDSSIYLSGFALSSGPSDFTITYSSTTLISLTGINVDSPFISKFSLQTNGSLNFEWITYALGQSSISGPMGSNLLPYHSDNSKFKITDAGGIYWGIGFNYDYINIYTTTPSSSSQLLYSISGSYKYQGNQSICIIALDKDADPYIINNIPFGYHILNGEYNLEAYNDSNFDLILDPAQNIIVSGNTNQFIPAFAYYTSTGTVDYDIGFSNFFIYSSGSTQYYLYANNPIYTTGASGNLIIMTTYDTNNLYDYNLSYQIPFVTSDPLNPYYGSLTGTISNSFFTQIICYTGTTGPNNQIYQISTPSHPNQLFDRPFEKILNIAVTIYTIDILSGTVNLIATSQNARFGYFYVLVYDNYIYLGAYDYKTPPGIFWIYKFDPNLNSFSYYSLPIPSIKDPTNFTNVVTGYITNNKLYFIVQSSNIFIQTIIEFDPISLLITVANSQPTRSYLMIQPTQTYNVFGRLIFVNSQNIGNPTIIYDVTDPYIPIVIYTVEDTAFLSSFVFSNTVNLITDYYMILSYNPDDKGYVIYNITDLNNIYLINGIYGNELFGYSIQNGPSPILGIDPKGYLYGFGVGVYANEPITTYRIKSFIQPNNIYSSHYYFNNKNIIPLNTLSSNTVYTSINIANINTHIFANISNITIYTSNLIKSNFILSINYPSIQTASPIFISSLKSGSYYYCAISFKARVYLYSYYNNAWILISTLLPSPTNQIFNAQLYSENLVVTEITGLVRKYLISGTTVTLISSVNPWSSVVTVVISLVVYYPNSNEYIIHIEVKYPIPYSIVIYLNTFTYVQTIILSALFATFPQTNISMSYGYYNNTVVYFASGSYSGLFQYSSSTPTTFERLSFGRYQFYWTYSVPQITTVVINDINSRVYLFTPSYYGTIRILDITDFNNMFQVTQDFNILNSIPFDTTTVPLQMIPIIQNGRIFISVLYKNNEWVIYEISNITNAITYINPVLQTTEYTNIQCYAGGFVHKIAYNGTPSWLDISGSILNENFGTNTYIKNICFDPNFNIYVIGSWSSRLSLFQTVGNYVGNYPVNNFDSTTSDKSSFIAKINSDKGNWIWGEVIVGNADIILNQAIYNSDLIVVSSFDSQNIFIYEPQYSVNNTGTYIFSPDLGNPQTYLFNSNYNSSAILFINSDGLFLEKSLIYSSTVIESNTYITSITLDSITQDIIIGGISNTSELICKDITSTTSQILYTNITNSNQYATVIYKFSSTGTYVSSVFQLNSINSINSISQIISYSQYNQTISLNNSQLNNIGLSTISSYNKDGTLAQTLNFNNAEAIALCSVYKSNSIYLDSNLLPYSRVFIYDYTGPQTSLIGYNLFLLGTGIVLNKNFNIRGNSYDENGNLIIILNQVINVNLMDRKINTIPNTYIKSNISQSPLAGIGYYISHTGNNLLLENIYGNIPINTSSQYYLSFPQLSTGSSTDIYSSIVPILNWTKISGGSYNISVQNINDLLVDGNLYGPYIYICEKNYSAYYTLQWYPGSRLYSQQYNVGLYSLTIPNRPLITSRFEGLNTIDVLPYFYLVMYNADENDNFKLGTINSVYDNNVNSPNFALFQIQTSLGSMGVNYITYSSLSTPKISFNPYFYKLHLRLIDDRGNLIIFDNTPYKSTDSLYIGGVVPDSFMNVSCNFIFKK
jgi:hypothetical protein